jgi:cob(I)alamin adenosyltransferase
MGSISTTRGDTGQTALAGGVRVSKASLRVEACGAIDELIAALGLARALCDDSAAAELARTIQLDLFQLGSSVATPPRSSIAPAVIEQAMVSRLTSEVHRFEAIEGLLSDWSLPGALAASAAFDVARTVCRRAERCIVRLSETGESIAPAILPYLNRLSDLLWLIGRKLEYDAGVNGSLRNETGREGNRWSRAW